MATIQHRQTLFEHTLAVVHLWIKLLRSASSPDVRESVFKDLCLNGTTTYTRIVLQFAQPHLKSDEGSLHVPHQVHQASV